MSYQQTRHYKRQQGVVIVLALFIVALIAVMSYTMIARVERDTRRTTLILRDTQAEFYAIGSIAWAIDKLNHDWEQKIPEKVVDDVPIKSPVNEVNGFEIASVIYDMQSRFNINMVNKQEAQLVLQQLIQIVDPAIKREEARAIVMAIVDWLGLGNPLSRPAEYYLHLPVPYRPAYKPFISTSELLLVKGMTPSLYRALQPFIAALPAETEINVQTAPAEVLASLSPTMTVSSVRTIVETRKQKPFLTLQQFLNLDAVKNHTIKDDLLTVTSQYFLVETTVSIEKQRLVLYTLLERVPKDRKSTVRILWQSKGVW
jgi:general secretion pathway protein K